MAPKLPPPAKTKAVLAAGGLTFADLQKRAKEAAAPIAAGDVEIEFQTDVIKVEGRAENVVGILRGSDPLLSSEYIVLGAHYDHLGLGGSESLAAKPDGQIHHGADDNASGTSVLIELARVLSAGRARLKRSVVFVAFSGEELGLLGSSFYVNNPRLPIDKAVAMINMDMIGRIRDGKVYVGGVSTGTTFKALFDELAPTSELTMDFSEIAGYGSSDHTSFTTRQVPVLFFFSGLHGDYHKPSDTWDKIAAPQAAVLLEFVADVAGKLASAPGRPRCG